jgi:hypothetical protein
MSVRPCVIDTERSLELIVHVTLCCTCCKLYYIFLCKNNVILNRNDHLRGKLFLEFLDLFVKAWC